MASSDHLDWKIETRRRSDGTYEQMVIGTDEDEDHDDGVCGEISFGCTGYDHAMRLRAMLRGVAWSQIGS